MPKWDIVFIVAKLKRLDWSLAVQQLCLSMPGETQWRTVGRPHGQLLKWIGSKQRLAHDMVSYFPREYNTYCEPFLGGGAVLATLAPERGIGSDCFKPLMEISETLSSSPGTLKRWYADRWQTMMAGDKVTAYERVKACYNANPNGADLLFLCRSCYGGVVRFRESDGHMSTPGGMHRPISPQAFARRVDEWHRRTAATRFLLVDNQGAMAMYGTGGRSRLLRPTLQTHPVHSLRSAVMLERLCDVIACCKSRGVYLALSIDGTKRSGNLMCNLPIPEGLFEREVLMDCGRSVLKRFQMGRQTLEGERVADRLLLTY
jgi:DNA adenine methylase